MTIESLFTSLTVANSATKVLLQPNKKIEEIIRNEYINIPDIDFIYSPPRNTLWFTSIPKYHQIRLFS